MLRTSWQCKALLALAIAATFATSALAFTVFSTHHGPITFTHYKGHDAPVMYFTGNFGELRNYTHPATVEVQSLPLNPGEVVPRDYHVGLTYAILASGSVASKTACGKTETFNAGTGFVESPGLVHTVKNVGNVPAVFYWATVYTDIEGVTDLNVLPEAPICN